MGLQLAYLTFIEAVIRQAGLMPDQQPAPRMCELGNQRIRDSAKDHTSARTGHEYFSALGFDHVALDTNGRDGALRVDLSIPLENEALIGHFDIVTNSGTSEHVRDQFVCFQNIHRLVRTGGLMVHLAPMVGSWYETHDHGEQLYTVPFFRDLALAAHYRVIRIEVVAQILGTAHDLVGMACLKGSGPFPDRATFARCLGDAGGQTT